MLIKGGVLFFAFGLLFFIGISGIEYFLWLNSSGRFLLFLLWICFFLFIFIRYLCIPLFYLFKLKKGINAKEASVLIGKHFPEVGDKLYNLLDLEEDTNRSELLLASIEQRSKNLKPIPFVNAINFKESLQHIKYIAIPLVLILIIGFSGRWNSYFGSYKRVVNYDLAYEAPAPFSFQLISNDLDVLQNQDFTIHVKVVGALQPEEVFIFVDDKPLLLQKQDGTYAYTFIAPLKPHKFYFKANEVQSRTYFLNALKTPSIEHFSMVLNYPDYTGISTDTLQSTGNASFPEGTSVTWKVNTKHTQNVQFKTTDTTITFAQKKDLHTYTKDVFNSSTYFLATSNKNIQDFEELSYTFHVEKDASPTLKVQQVLDSLQPNIAYFTGTTADDYKIKYLKVYCYQTDTPSNIQSVVLAQPNSLFHNFYYTFPSGFTLEKGIQYSLYFESTDNDPFRGGKSSKSRVFTFDFLDDKELLNKDLISQKSIVSNLDKSLKNLKEQKEALQELNRVQKETKQLNYNDKKQIKDFLKQQKQEESLMQKFSKQLKDNLEKTNKNNPQNKLLQERLKRQELQAKKNEKLLEELAKVSEKINKDNLSKKLEDLAKKQQNSARNLEQLVELTKRYYVTEKLNQLANDLKDLSKKQKTASQKKVSDSSLKEQQDLNAAFDALAKELQDLENDNQALKKPLDLDTDVQKQQSIKDDQKNASNTLENEASNPSKNSPLNNAASSKQKSAAQKMKDLGESMENSASSSSSGSSIAEDAAMLRQILDNLVVFSFKQEDLYTAISNDKDVDIAYSNRIKEQKDLRLLFEHVDDSLFSLSLRREELSEFVNEQITDVFYNIDKALVNFADNKSYQGVSNQKYVLTAANSLSDFLVNVLDSMQQSMQMGKGEGQSPDGFQLPDLIRSQDELQKKMNGSRSSGQEKPGGSSGSGKQGTSPSSKGSGQSGESGSKGKGGSSGEQSGTNGKGSGGSSGEGKNGKGKTGSGIGSGSWNGSGTGTGGNNFSESDLKEIYEIYQSQQTIRLALEKQLKDMLNSGDQNFGTKLVRQMQDFENDLLENGITQRTANKMNTIHYKFLKLENAALKQGKKSERESSTTTNNFSNPITTKPSLLENYRNETEILNRQSLPLRQIFKNRVKTYFKKND